MWIISAIVLFKVTNILTVCFADLSARHAAFYCEAIRLRDARPQSLIAQAGRVLILSSV